MNCSICNQPVDPTLRTVYTRVQGWERKALNDSRRSGSDIVLRERLPEVAHSTCVENARMGVTVGQGALL